MKKLIVLFVLLLALAVPAMAYGDLLVDDADLLTIREEQQLTEQLEQASEEWDLDIVIVTVDGLYGEYIRDYADDYYDYNGYAEDGVLLLIDVDSRQWWISGTGKGTEIFTSSVIDLIGDAITEDLSDGNYAAAFETFIDQCVYYADDSFDVVGALMIALIVGVSVALIVTLVWKGQLKSVRAKNAAADYVKAGSLNITGSQDLYLYSNVVKVKRQQTSSGTHVSSSGRSHSGGGGRF